MTSRINLRPIFAVLRPEQWTKNIVLFAGLGFAMADLERLPISFFPALHRTIVAFVLFCLASGCVYIVNDLKDVEADRIHPEKRKRPIASGSLSPLMAATELALLLTVTAALAPLLGVGFALSLGIYLLLQVLYTFVLKRFPILDVSAIAAGFSIRVWAGTAAACVGVSKWIILCTFFLMLLVALCKRRAELIELGDDAPRHRAVLARYTTRYLSMAIVADAVVTCACYLSWTILPSTIKKFGTHGMVYSAAIVGAGILRYVYLALHKNLGSRPEKLFLRDSYLITILISYVLYIIFTTI